MRKFLRSASVAAAVAILVPAIAPAHDLAVPGKSPASAVAVVSLNDTKALWQGFSASPLLAPIEKMFSLPSLAEDASYAEFLSEKAKAEADLGYAINGASVLGEVLKGVDIYILPNPGGASDVPNFVFTANFSQEALATKTADHFAKRVAGEGESAQQVTEMDIAGTKVRAVPSQQFYLANSGSVLYLSTTEQGIRETIEAKGPSALLTSPDFTQAMSGLNAKPAQMWIYGDGNGIAALLESVPGEMGMAAAGMKDKTIAVVGNVTADQIRFSNFVPAAKFSESDKVIASTTTGNVAGPSKFFSGTGLMAFNSAKIDWAKMVDATAVDAAKLGPEASAANPLTRDSLNAMAGSLGLSFDNDILPALGPEIGASLGSLIFNPMASSGNPIQADFVIAMKVNDPGKASGLMAKLEAALNGYMKQQFEERGVAAPAELEMFKDGDAGGAKSRVLSPPAGMEGNMPVLPAYSITQDGYLVLAASEQGLKDSMARSTGGQNLSTSETAARVSKQGVAGDNSTAYVDLPKIVDFASGPIMMFAGGSMQPAEREMLVVGFDLVKALGLAYVGVSYDATGKKTDVMLLMK